ncbi:MAG: TonB-dependent receptor [Bacteroidales bacterium]|jgi:iron complex outermembrane receptor protein|nr:TonB-dependent receptor [Bacteroidales bacterium]NLM91422.1 TonB-dependent receptor [Bacteroidales bacterium]
MRQKNYLLLLFLMIFNVPLLFGQMTLKGVVKEESGQPLPGATIRVKETSQGTVSLPTGTFELRFSEAGQYNIEIRYMGYETLTRTVNINQNTPILEVFLKPEAGLVAGVVVTGTRTSREVYDIPLRLDVIDQKQVNAIPALSADEYLRSLPGMNVGRSASFLSSSTVTMRGMSNEQGRVLVLQDGVPLNKSDGGSVNWNALDPLAVEQVEVLKGPGSSIHGGNAMGGVINFISAIPTKPFQGSLRQSYGTFETARTNLDLSGRKGNFYWRTGGFYRLSDGYVTTPQDEIDEYTVAAFLDEYQASGRVGYLFSDQHLLEAGIGYYSGKRGTGTLYEGFDLAAPEGSYNNYGNVNGSLNYKGTLADDISLDITAYGQRENYQNIRESTGSSGFSRYDVESIRSDLGLFTNLNFNNFMNHSLLAGLDIRHGGVDGADIYLTSTDQVLNLGKMNQFGLFLQDEFNPGGGPWRLLTGIRFDYAKFFDGAFRVLDPTNQTAFLQDYDGDLEEASWSAFSPRISAQYNQEGAFRVFAGYSRGFRAPVLDDMCRTGRISGGMKLANPYLEPEYLDNFELGADFFPGNRIRISPTVFYSMGKDYHAYIATGDSLVMNNRLRPIRIMDNIGKVNIMGVELAGQFQLTSQVSLLASYSFIDTEIMEYRVFNPSVDESLTGKELVYQPKNIAYAGVFWEMPWLSVFASYQYKDAQWLNDVNTEEIDAFGTLDLQVRAKIYRWISAGLMVHNLLDTDYVDSRNILAPGRMITAELRFTF